MKKIGLGVALALTVSAIGVALSEEPKVDFIVHAKDAPPSPVALWTQDGKPMVARGADVAKAPKDAAVVHSRTFSYSDGNAIREVHLTKGTKYTPPGGHTTIIYVAKGHLRVKEGDAVGEVMAGESFSEIMDRPTVIEVLEDSTDIEVSFPPPEKH